MFPSAISRSALLASASALSAVTVTYAFKFERVSIRLSSASVVSTEEISLLCIFRAMVIAPR